MASISATAQVNEEQSSKWTLTPQVGYTMGGTVSYTHLTLPTNREV